MVRNYLADAASELAGSLHATLAPGRNTISASAPEWVFSLIRNMREDGHLVDYCAFHAHAVAEHLRKAALADQDLADAAERYRDATPPSDTYVLLWAAHYPAMREMAFHVSHEHDAIWDREYHPVTLLRQVYYHCLLFWAHMVRRAIEDRAGEMRVQEVLQ